MIDKINASLKKFNLNLEGQIVLTEAATGNYVVTSIIAALGGAKQVYAYTKDSKYGKLKDVLNETYTLAKKFGVDDRIKVIDDFNQIDFQNVDILTNTGFLRPIDKKMIDKLSNRCVIPLMWEPWEFRNTELDLDYCFEKGIKVYGTNEKDPRLQTMNYLGFIVLNFLLNNKMSPYSTKLLILGNKSFTDAIINIVRLNGYTIDCFNDYKNVINIESYNAIIISEHKKDRLLIGSKNAFIDVNKFNNSQFIIHICGNVDFSNIKCKVNTKTPAKFGYMSFTTDYIDNQAVIDLHTAGLKVAEGMLEANKRDLKGVEYKNFMESEYPALAFNDKKYF